MKEKKLDCKNAKKIHIKEYLNKLGESPKKEFNSYGMYKAFWRNEKSASVKVDYQLNLFYDFGTSQSGDIINLIQLIYKCNVAKSLQILSSTSFSFHQQPEIIKQTPTYAIKKITGLENPNLLSYLSERKINLQFAKQFCIQIHYTFSNVKTYYGIGFKNDFGGYEIRNKFFKGCLGKKTFTSIKNNSAVVSIFESWSDFLSYLTLKKKIPNEDFIILNSTTMINSITSLTQNYKIIKLFFDNDSSGDIATNIMVKNHQSKIIDNRIHYKKYNDLNDYLKSII